MGRAGWLEAVAVIRESDRVGHEPADQGEPWPWELHLNRFGTNTYDFTLEVTVRGAEPYLVADHFKVPKKAENPAGVELPVRVDRRDGRRIEVEWERWLDSPGRKDAFKAGRAAADAAAMRAHLGKNPKLQAKARANNKSAAMAWAQGVRLGNLTREQFERQLTLEVDHGRMDPADAAAARAALDG